MRACRGTAGSQYGAGFFRVFLPPPPPSLTLTLPLRLSSFLPFFLPTRLARSLVLSRSFIYFFFSRLQSTLGLCCLPLVRLPFLSLDFAVTLFLSSFDKFQTLSFCFPSFHVSPRTRVSRRCVSNSAAPFIFLRSCLLRDFLSIYARARLTSRTHRNEITFEITFTRVSTYTR